MTMLHFYKVAVVQYHQRRRVSLCSFGSCCVSACVAHISSST